MELIFSDKYACELHDAINTGTLILRTMKKMEKLFHILFEHSTDGLALFELPEEGDGAPRMVMCNDMYLQLAGRTREVLVSARFDEYMENVNFLASSFNMDDHGFETTFSWRRPDEKDNFILARNIPVELAGVQYLYLIHHDITSRRHIENMYRRKHSAVENAGAGIAIIDEQFIITYVNPAAVSMFRFEYSGELLGVSGIGLWANPDDCQQLLQDVVKEEQTVCAEFDMVRNDHTAFTAEIAAARNVDLMGNGNGLVLSFVDVTDRKHAEQQKAMLASLGAACHHFGQPMQSLMFNFEMIKMDYSGDPELIDGCEEAIDQLGELLRKFNAMSEYRTVPYGQFGASGGDVILEIE